MQVNRDAPEPLWSQLAGILRARIEAGTLRGRIPAYGRLAVDYDVAEMTVRHAVRVLREEGLVVSVPGRGTFVAERPG